MRKRIVTGLLVIAAVIVVLVLVKNRDDAIEHHKKGYMAASEGRVWNQEWSNRIKKLLGQAPSWRSDSRRMKYHERALIGLEYLDERILVVSNSSPQMVERAVYRAAWRSSGWVKVDVLETNKVRIVGMKGELADLELAANIADVRDANGR